MTAIAGAALAGARFGAGRIPLVLVAGAIASVGAVIAMATVAGPRRRATVAAAGAAVFITCSVLSGRSLDGLRLADDTLRKTSCDLELTRDPSRTRNSVAAEARCDGKRVLVRASGGVGAQLAQRSAGDFLSVRGRLRNIDGPVATWMKGRHIAGRMSITGIDAARSGGHLARFANGIRSRLLASAEVLPESQRGLFAGFVLGDDRGQPPEVVDDFRASGLSHLLVVSGQNVAFTMAVLEPALSRLRRRRRLIATVCVLVLFATVTRFEPSVLRAVWMAGVVAIARCLGRPQKGLRVLAVSVIALLLIDPLLAMSLGFLLSMSATAGLALWSEPLRDRLPLPAGLRSAMAPTMAAQGGACIVMIPAFGSIPVVSLLANVAVVPLASPLMGWGVAAGIPAGLLGRAASQLVHTPTSWVLSIVARSAQLAAVLPLGSVGAVPTAGFALLTWHTCRSRQERRRRLWCAGLVALLAWPTLHRSAVPPRPLFNQRIERGVTVWSSPTGTWSQRLTPLARSAQVVVITHDVDVERMLGSLRLHNITAIDVLVVVNGCRPQATVVRALTRRLSVGVILVRDLAFGGGVPQARSVKRSLHSRFNGLSLQVGPVSATTLAVSVTRLAFPDRSPSA